MRTDETGVTFHRDHVLSIQKNDISKSCSIVAVQILAPSITARIERQCRLPGTAELVGLIQSAIMVMMAFPLTSTVANAVIISRRIANRAVMWVFYYTNSFS